MHTPLKRSENLLILEKPKCVKCSLWVIKIYNNNKNSDLHFCLGRCNLGGNCQFAHGEVELRSTPNLFKTSLCTVFAKTNSCPHGDKCRYAHGEHDIRPP
jgi:hypothetical protein